MAYYLQPKFYSNFKCIGGKCPRSCCVGWRIDWYKSEIEKLRSAPNASEDLKLKIENSFIPNDDIYYGSPDEH